MQILLMMAVVPAAILLWYVYRMDPVEKEPTALLGRLLLAGMLSTVPAMVIEPVATALVFGDATPSTLAEVAFDNFVIVALTEECCKYLALCRHTWHDSYDFDYVFDGIVYAVFVGLGFAIAENVLYVFEYGPSTAVVRAFTAIPGHCVFAVFMGLFYGHARLAARRGRHVTQAAASLCAVAVPVLCHGTYDTLASLGTDESALLFMGFLVLMVAIGMLLARRTAARAERIPHSR